MKKRRSGRRREMLVPLWWDREAPLVSNWKRGSRLRKQGPNSHEKTEVDDLPYFPAYEGGGESRRRVGGT